MYQQRHLQPLNNPIIHAFHSSQANHLSLGFNASIHWHHLRFVNGGRMKHLTPTHSKAYRLPSFMASPRFAGFVQFLAIPCCHPQYLFQSFILHASINTSPLSDTSIAVQYFIKTLSRTHRLTSTGFIVYLILHLIIYRFLYRCAE